MVENCEIVNGQKFRSWNPSYWPFFKTDKAEAFDNFFLKYAYNPAMFTSQFHID